MSPTGTRRCLAVLLSAVLIGLVRFAAAEEPDWQLYAELLDTYVSQGELDGVQLNRVDYDGLHQDDRFQVLLEQLQKFSPEHLRGERETMAFYINVYNILAIKTVLDNWPVESIKDVGSLFKPVWKRDAGVVGGETLSLDEIEHGRLRKMGDPRIHLAIVCASISCPDLRSEPYRASTLAEQLEDQCRRFLDNPVKGLRLDGKHAHVSKIFKWFGDDFEKRYGSVEAFLRRYHALPEHVSVEPDLDYNWGLNGWVVP